MQLFDEDDTNCDFCSVNVEQEEIIPSAVVGIFLSSILLSFRISDWQKSISDYFNKQSIPKSDRRSVRL